MKTKTTPKPGPEITVSPQTRRRFILGRSGLWPGRRWQGKQGAANAIVALESLQIDPVMVIAQSHDLALWGRVADYQPDHLSQLMDEERKFFAYGGCLYIYPMPDLPLIKTLMEQARQHPRYDQLEADHPGLIASVMDHVRQNGPSRSRKMEGNAVTAYRSGKDVGLALYYSWYIGELMIHGRAGRDRVYDLTERIAPAEYNYTADRDKANLALTLKSIRAAGLATEKEAKFQMHWITYVRYDAILWNTIFTQLLESGSILPIKVEGDKTTHYIAAEDLQDLLTVHNGGVPEAWQPLSTTTEQEVVFLSPLDYVTARSRAKKLFDFNYVWEIYTPAVKRVYGPYTLPILYRDQLVGRMDGRHDRANGKFIVNGRWLEEWFEPTSEFEAAYEAGLNHLKNFLNK